jgi:hypothetical protein
VITKKLKALESKLKPEVALHHVQHKHVPKCAIQNSHPIIAHFIREQQSKEPMKK